MSSVTATARCKNSENPDKYIAYHGKTIELPINNPSQIMQLEELCDLWYMQFQCRGVHYLAAGCVFDIDLAGDRKALVAAATLQKNVEALLHILKPEMTLISEALKTPYCVYASGSKGIHVYSKNPDGFISSDDPRKFTPAIVKEYMKTHFSNQEFVSVLDMSFYTYNKGIRPLSCRHPVTKVEPFLLYASPEWGDPFECDSGILCWIAEQLKTRGPDIATSSRELEEQIVTTLEPLRTKPVVHTTVVKTPSSKEIHISLRPGQTLDQWIEEQCGHKRRCVSAGQYIYFSSAGKTNTWCPVAKSEHPTNCCCWIQYEGGIYKSACFDFACIGVTVVLLEHREPITYPIGVPANKITMMDPPSDSPYLNGSVVLQALAQYKRLVLTAPMGSGKTKVVNDFINNLPVDARVLVIGTRRAQIGAWGSNVFTDFTVYEQAEGSLVGVDRLLICLNSLIRILTPPDVNGICTLKPYDLLVMDEADSLASWLGGPLLDNNAAIFNCLKLLIKTSTYTICMDGLPTKALTAMLEQLGYADDFHWLVFNSFRFREALFVNHTGYFKKTLENYLSAGKNIFFVSNSKTVITRFKDYVIHLGVPSTSVLAIHGGMSEEDRRLGANPDDWLRYRVVLANTSLGPGSSFNPASCPGHFSVIFALVKVNQGAIPSQVTQLMYRVRHPKENKFIVMVLKKRTNVAQGQVTQQEILSDRFKVISTYGQGVVEAIGPQRELRKRQTCERAIQTETSRVTSLGKTMSPLKRRALQFEHTLVPIPIYNHETGSLEASPRLCTFGLRLANTNLEKLSALVTTESLVWSSDSEVFMEEMKRLLSCSGSGIRTLGARTELDSEGADKVLRAHYSFLDQIKAECSSDDSQQLDNDFFLCKVKMHIPEEKYLAIRKKFYETKEAGLQSCLFRFYHIVTRYDDSIDSVRNTIDRDVQVMFEDIATEPPLVSGNQFRPQSHPRGAPLTQRETPGELLYCFYNVLACLNIHWDSTMKTFFADHSYSTRTYIDGTLEYKQQLWSVVQDFTSLALRGSVDFKFFGKLGVQGFLSAASPYEAPADHRVLFGVLYALLSWAGFPVVKKTFRYMLNKKRHAYHEIRFDLEHIRLCKAIVGLDKTGQRVDLLESLKELNQ